MPNHVYEMTLAGHTIRYRFRRAKTKYFFRPFLRGSRSEDWDILLNAEDLARGRLIYDESFPDSYVEFRSLRQPSSRFLMGLGCCIFHATAFLYQGGAWLLAAPSGTGKTTQYLNWQRLYPGEIEMICGDMPVLEDRAGTVWVHPSPWNGKENMGGTAAAPLAGIVFLEQGQANRAEKMPARELIKAALQQLVCRPNTEKECLSAAKLLDAALRNARAFRFVNRGDDASTELLREMIRREDPDDAKL